MRIQQKAESLMNKFIFDVDGTITPSRQPINSKFKNFFKDFCRDNKVFLVTGSDRPKTIEQIGEDIYNMAHTVYNCNGNDVWQGKKHIRKNDWWLKNTEKQWLENMLEKSKFQLRTGLHFESRPGMINFSIVGRNANQEERKQYVEWDQSINERQFIVKAFNTTFPFLEAKIGGETGIDISPKGFDKSQIVKDFNKDDVLWFFGDAIYEGGNDYPLAQVVHNYRKVDRWQQTKEYLEIFQDEGIAN